MGLFCLNFWRALIPEILREKLPLFFIYLCSLQISCFIVFHNVSIITCLK